MGAGQRGSGLLRYKNSGKRSLHSNMSRLSRFHGVCFVTISVVLACKTPIINPQLAFPFTDSVRSTISVPASQDSVQAVCMHHAWRTFVLDLRTKRKRYNAGKPCGKCVIKAAVPAFPERPSEHCDCMVVAKRRTTQLSKRGRMGRSLALIRVAHGAVQGHATANGTPETSGSRLTVEHPSLGGGGGNAPTAQSDPSDTCDARLMIKKGPYVGT